MKYFWEKNFVENFCVEKHVSWVFFYENIEKTRILNKKPTMVLEDSNWVDRPTSRMSKNYHSCQEKGFLWFTTLFITDNEIPF